MENNLLNRKTYKAVKKMDRQEMESFFKDIYKLGFQDGVEAGDNADFRIQLSEVLNNTKGIGIKLYDRIMKTAKEMEI